MSSDFQKFKESQETIILILYMAMFSSICLFFALVEMGIIKGPESSSAGFPLHYVSLLPTAASLFIHYKLKSPEALARATLAQVRNDTSPNSNYSDNENRMRFFFPHYLTRMVLSLALNESVTIFGMMGILMGSTTLVEFYSTFGLSLFLMAIMKPKTKETFNQVEKILMRENY